jgi:hypothetical protein
MKWLDRRREAKAQAEEQRKEADARAKAEQRRRVAEIENRRWRRCEPLFEKGETRRSTTPCLVHRSEPGNVYLSDRSVYFSIDDRPDLALRGLDPIRVPLSEICSVEDLGFERDGSLIVRFEWRLSNLRGTAAGHGHHAMDKTTYIEMCLYPSRISERLVGEIQSAVG